MEINKKVLITGHAGFIGTWVTSAFLAKGWTVHGLDNMSSFGQRLYDKISLTSDMQAELVSDVSEPEKWETWAANLKPDLIIHLAGQAIVPRAFKEPFNTFKTNALGTLAILDVANRLTSVKSVLCITSDKVYENDNSGRAFTETDPLGGKDIYSVSKSSAELIARAYVQNHVNRNDLSIQTIRLGNVVGGGDWSVNRLLPDLIYAVEHNQEFHVRYLEATRPFQHVSDVVKGIQNIADASLANSIPSGDCWNLGPKENSWASVREVIDYVNSLYPNLNVLNDENRVKEDLNLSVIVDKYSQRFGKPRYTALESIELSIRWYKDYYAHVEPEFLIARDLY